MLKNLNDTIRLKRFADRNGAAFYAGPLKEKRPTLLFTRGRGGELIGSASFSTGDIAEVASYSFETGSGKSR